MRSILRSIFPWSNFNRNGGAILTLKNQKVIFNVLNWSICLKQQVNLIDHTVFKGLDERLEFYLKKQRDAFKSDELKITHEEIANDLGTSRVVISRLLKSMEQAGKLKLNRNAIDLKNMSV